MGWFEAGAAAVAAGCVVAMIAAAFSPTQILTGWGLSLVVLVLWPESWSDLGQSRWLGAPLEYIPLLLVVGCSTLSAIFRRGVPLHRMDKTHLAIAGGLLAYGAASFLWTPNRAGAAKQIVMFVVYFAWFFWMTSELRRAGLDGVLKLLERLVLCATVFAVVGCLRVFITDGRYVGDFTPIIEYRSSEVMTVYSASLFAVFLYGVQGRGYMLGCAVVLWASMLLTFSRTGMVGQALAGGLLLGLSWFCRGDAGRRVRQTAVVLGCGAAVALASIAVLSPNTVRALAERAESIRLAFDIFGGDSELEARADDGGRRATLLRLCAAAHQRRPWLGRGMGGYLANIRDLTDDEYLWARSHNFYYSYLSEYGWAGFVPLSGFVYWFVWSSTGAFVRLRFGKLRLGAAVAIAGSLPIGVMMVAQEFISAPYIWMHWILIAATAAAAKDLQAEQAPQRNAARSPVRDEASTGPARPRPVLA